MVGGWAKFTLSFIWNSHISGRKKRKHLSHKTVYSVPFTQNLKSFFARKSLTQDLLLSKCRRPL
uniref:Uncharacterized protein n=1 Tax=Anguilla anguilla TaxID=7936 RepID=A0A0E9U8S5_ANGAN